ncbi:hypothetical protein AB0M02_27215 [Actinoplanes sp. NPDC051861]|uniref:hypothetical protein n=1 Tax=Actinoplanes sp. NPDC051861 TaxID=3155170 RepID=UPI00342E41BB
MNPIRLAVRIHGRPEPEMVDFSPDQPGASGMIGYGEGPAGRYVLKVLKVADLREALRGRMREPLYVTLLRRLPLADSSFAPTRSLRSRIGRFHDTCHLWLRDIDLVRARALLAAELPQIGPARRDVLLGGFYAERTALQLMPRMSRLVDVDFPQLGPADVPALWQSRVAGTAYRLPMGRGRSLERAIPLLLLLATARRLARTHSVGLDMSCRFDVRDGCLVFPNVMAPSHTNGLAYVDFFGWGTPLGNLAERTGYRLGYGERGPGRWLLRTVVRRVSPP